MKTTIQLIDEDGTLHTLRSDIKDAMLRDWYSSNPVLLNRYGNGECDTVAWPLVEPKWLAQALYDAREMGIIPDVESVILPDGTEFLILENL